MMTPADAGPAQRSGGALEVFALNSDQPFAAAVCDLLRLPIARHEEREFDDGEHKTRPLEAVRGKDVYLVASLVGGARHSVNDKLCRALFFLGALRDAGAKRLTAVVPYLCYARKDRRTKARDPVTTRYVARFFEAVGVDRVLTLDVHDLAAYENAFRISVEHLEARPLLLDYFVRKLPDGPVVVVAPDAGGVKRAERFRQALERKLGRGVGSAFMEKLRSEGRVTGEVFAGDVSSSTAVIVDDLIASGGTLLRVARACRQRGARSVFAAATHGVFTPEASALFASETPLDQVVITNSVPARFSETATSHQLVVLDAAPLIAEAIRRLHTDGSLLELNEL
ncbi:MAG TPA: ribose-phosphate pyrophosphokinase [Polyangiaceae bacterium]